MKKVLYFISIKILISLFLLTAIQVAGDTRSNCFKGAGLNNEKKEKLSSKRSHSLEMSETTKNGEDYNFSSETNFYISIAIVSITSFLIFIRLTQNDQKKYSHIYDNTSYLKKFK